MEAEKEILGSKEAEENGEGNKKADEEFNKMIENPLFKEHLEELDKMISDIHVDNE